MIDLPAHVTQPPGAIIPSLIIHAKNNMIFALIQEVSILSAGASIFKRQNHGSAQCAD